MIDIYDKNGNRLLDLKKYTSKEKKEDEFYDKEGKKITNLKKNIRELLK